MMGENNPAKRALSRKKISDAKKGKSTWNKGGHLTKEWKEKIGKANKVALLGRICSEEHKLNVSKGLKKIMTPEYRKILGDAHRGEKGSNWKGGITPKILRIRNSVETVLWREAVFARDHWTCQKTGIKKGPLNAHHIKNFAEFPELRFAISNGITLSEKSHQEFHKKYGRKNNTEKQLIEFLNI